MIHIGGMVDAMITQLLEDKLVVGDGIAPTEGGWDTGQSNVGSFVPYTVVDFGGANPAMPDLSVATDWDVTIALRHYGGARQQCDWQATRARISAELVRRTTVGDFTIIGVKWRTLGAMARNDQVDPPYWSTFDSLVLTCSD